MNLNCAGGAFFYAKNTDASVKKLKSIDESRTLYMPI